MRLIMLWGGLLSSMWLAGFFVIQIVARFAPLGLYTRILFAFPVGSAALGIVLFSLNEFSGVPITRSLVFGVTIPLALGGGVVLASRIKGIRPSLFHFPWFQSGTNRLEKGVLVIQIAALVLLGVRQLLECWMTPIPFVDVQNFHYPFAKIIFDTHKIPNYADPSSFGTVYASSPLFFLDYAIGWLWLDKVHLFFPSLLTFLFSVLLLTSVFSICRDRLGISASVSLGAVFLILLPGPHSLTQLLLWGGNPDIVFAFWATAAVYFLLSQQSAPNNNSWVWCSICLAMACWSKPLGFLFTASFGIVYFIEWVIVRYSNPLDHKPFLFSFIKTVLLVGLILSPFLIRNWIQWGNPVYSFLSNLFGGYLVDVYNALSADNPIANLPKSYFRMFQGILGGVPAAFCFLFICHPKVIGNHQIRLVCFISIAFLLIYVSYWGVIPLEGVADSSPYIRYLLPGILLLSLLFSFITDITLKDKANLIILLILFSIQTGFFYYKLDQQIWHFPEPDKPGFIKIILYDNMPLALTTVFLSFSLWNYLQYSPLRTKMATALFLSGLPLLLSFTWSISRPWTILSQPLRRSSPDWTSPQLVSPYGIWMTENLPQDAVILSFEECRRWIVPRPIMLPEFFLLRPCLTTKISAEEKLLLLAETGVTHILLLGKDGHPESRTPFAWSKTGKYNWNPAVDPDFSPYLKEVFRGQPVLPSEDSDGFTERESFIYEIIYPDQVRQILDAPRDRPWLYDYSGSSIPYAPPPR